MVRQLRSRARCLSQVHTCLAALVVLGKKCFHCCTFMCSLPFACTVDGINFWSLKPGNPIEIVVTTEDGEQVRTFCDKDGWFTIQDVPPGTHVLNAYHKDFVFPEVKVQACVLSCLIKVHCMTHHIIAHADADSCYKQRTFGKGIICAKQTAGR